MTRTNKWTVHEKQSEPRYFTHNGHYDTNPNHVSKNGSGKFNWGKPGDELMDEDLEQLGAPCAGRRNSNHNLHEQSMQAKAKACESQLDM